MKTRLILISTHCGNILLAKMANRSSHAVVLTFKDPITSADACIPRKKEVLDWIFKQIEGIKPPELHKELENIKEILICIDFNIGHSGENFSPLKNIVEQINSNKIPLKVVREKEELVEVLKTLKTPVELLLTGQGSGFESIPLESHKGDGETCDPMNRQRAIRDYGYTQHDAFQNLASMYRDEKASRETSPQQPSATQPTETTKFLAPNSNLQPSLFRHSTYTTSSHARETQSSESCCAWLKSCCSIL